MEPSVSLMLWFNWLSILIKVPHLSGFINIDNLLNQIIKETKV
jgi:hypothetical protein